MVACEEDTGQRLQTQCTKRELLDHHVYREIPEGKGGLNYDRGLVIISTVIAILSGVCAPAVHLRNEPSRSRSG